MTQLLGKSLRHNPRAAGSILGMSIMILFATCFTGYNHVRAARQEHAPAVASSQDVSGVWVGQMSEKMTDGRVGHGSFYLRLQQNGHQLSGVAGEREATASPIDHVVLTGEHLKFSMTGGHESDILWRIELDAGPDAMAGKGHALRSSDNHAWDVEIKLARNK